MRHRRLFLTFNSIEITFDEYSRKLTHIEFLFLFKDEAFLQLGWVRHYTCMTFITARQSEIFHRF